MDEWINAIAQYGFPIVMCLWFMFRTEKVISANTDVMLKIHEVITKCSGGKK